MTSYSTVGWTDDQKAYLRLALHHLRGQNDRHDYEELASEAVLGAFAAVAESQGDREWLQKVATRGAKSAIADYWKHQGRRKRTAELVSLEDECAAGREPLTKDFAPDLVARIAWVSEIRQTCNPEQQRYLGRFYFLGESYEEIARAEAATRKRVDNVIYQALRRLRTKLCPEGSLQVDRLQK